MHQSRTFVIASLLGLALGLVAVVALTSPRAANADAANRTSFEYKQVLIPLDRNLRNYEANNRERLQVIQSLGAQGWELVNAYEPSNGVKIGRDASVEFWFKRPTN